METKEAGIAFVIFGKIRMIAIVKATNPAIIKKGEPVSHSVCPLTTVLNCSNCDIKIITAKPFTKPNITG